MNGLYWREPLWALAGLLPSLWLVAQYWHARRLRSRYADPALWPWALARADRPAAVWRRACLISAWLLLGLAAAGPRLPGYVPAEGDQAAGQLVMVLDLSRSMAAEDVWPSRRGLALAATAGALPELAGTRAGLVVTAGRPHLLWPMSSDRRGLAALIERLDALRMPSEGSDLAGAVRLAHQTLRDTPRNRVLLLISDGDLDAAAARALAEALAEAAEAGVQLLLAGSGTTAGAAMPDRQGGWLLDDNGQPRLTRLATQQLQALAERLQGRYLTLPEQGAQQALLAALPAELRRLPLDPDAPVVWQELFGWLLLPALGMWALASLRLPAVTVPAGMALLGLYAAGLVASLPVHGDGLADAHRALQAGDAQRARELYAALPGYAGRMGTGSSCHRLQDWQCARQAFTAAILGAPDDPARARAVYNLAHTLFQQGDYVAAAELFEDALRYRPDYPAARHNRDFARQLADEVARLADRPQERRAGRGATAAGPTAEATADDQLPRLLDETAGPARGLSLGPDQRRQLLERGLRFTQLAQAATESARPWGELGGAERPEQADISLWQTLVERAEGLPASPAQPRRLPGVRPW